MTIGAILGTIAIIAAASWALWPKTQRKLDELDSKLIATDGKTVRVVDKINFVSAPRTWNSFRKGHN